MCMLLKGKIEPLRVKIVYCRQDYRNSQIFTIPVRQEAVRKAFLSKPFRKPLPQGLHRKAFYELPLRQSLNDKSTKAFPRKPFRKPFPQNRRRKASYEPPVPSCVAPSVIEATRVHLQCDADGEDSEAVPARLHKDRKDPEGQLPLLGRVVRRLQTQTARVHLQCDADGEDSEAVPACLHEDREDPEGQLPLLGRVVRRLQTQITVIWATNLTDEHHEYVDEKLSDKPEGSRFPGVHSNDVG
ncbi:hypothetical protein AVEN_11721-1 [Araneus ventricosus]|uniref:Uncharacterized protein n=1 Tax=Araneus ventricosus TaxID=182803 RepID=A0A4Y2IFE8_ARAVE|nr:hypothetical protein AVEN_11721-1 [Araneus ventricosus]